MTLAEPRVGINEPWALGDNGISASIIAFPPAPQPVFTIDTVLAPPAGLSGNTLNTKHRVRNGSTKTSEVRVPIPTKGISRAIGTLCHDILASMSSIASAYRPTET
jgi:hypothetical protein